jgi:hypothetical protein
MHRNSLITMLLALIQVLVSGALLGYLLIVHGVLALFSGTGDYELSRSATLIILRYSFYILTGLTLIFLRNKFALILAYVSAIIAMADICNQPFNVASTAILIFYVVYLVWFVWISDSYFEKPEDGSTDPDESVPPALPDSLSRGATDGT